MEQTRAGSAAPCRFHADDPVGGTVNPDKLSELSGVYEKHIGNSGYCGSAPGRDPAVRRDSVVTPPWIGPTLTGLNDAGQMAGFGGNGGSQAFIATTSTWAQIPLPPQFSLKFVTGINDAGLVGGYGNSAGQTASGYQGFLGTARASPCCR